MQFFISSLIVLALCAPSAFAADKKEDKPAVAEEKDSEPPISDILNSMGYPELQVVPRATERLRMEAKAESGSWFVTHWPVQVSGLATLAVGLTSEANQADGLEPKELDDAKTIRMMTIATGAAWVVGGVLIGAQRPYLRGQKAVSRISGKDERGALTRERMAEEALEKPARTMRVLEHVAVASNVTMNLLSGIYADDKGKVYAALGIILATMPYMFQDHSISVYDKHIEYKKKIYTPMKGASLWADPGTGKLTPLTTLAWTF